MSVSQNRTYIVDASIALKWFLADEPFAHEAGGLLDALRGGRLRLIAPDHVRYEVANALRVAQRANRVSSEHAEQSITEFLSLPIPMYGTAALILKGFAYSAKFDCAVYDGLYLALADMAQCPLIHADRRLHNTLGGNFARELWIEDYAPAQT